MSRLVLRPLTLDDEAEASAAHAELAADGFGFLLFRDEHDSWADYIAWLAEAAQGRGLIGRMVASSLWLAEVDGVIVGRSSIRHELNDWLSVWGGHIGYGVRPAHRRRGHATAILRRSLEICADLGIERALVTCDLDNHASAATIERCGGLPDPDLPVADTDDGSAPKRRYWVPTS